jgi:hypothetical protein
LLSAILLTGLPGAAETYNSWIALHFSPAEIAAGLASPARDDDGDLCPNIVEYFGGSDPRDRASAFVCLFAGGGTPEGVTVRFPAAADRADVDHVVLVSNDCAQWSGDAVYVCHDGSLMYHLNGHRFARIGVRPKPGVTIDSDSDGLRDFFEESMLREDPGDPFRSLADILPGDDFDGDGTPNIDEPANQSSAGAPGKPVLLDPEAVACAVREMPPFNPPVLLVHTQLQ